MDRETSIGWRVAMIGTIISLAITLVAHATMAASSVTSYIDYDQFLRFLVVANVIQFIVLAVMLVFFINDAGELENFTKSGLLEKAWAINAAGVVTMVVAGAMLGYALSLMFLTWEEWLALVDLAAVYAPVIRMMTWSMFVQALGFAIPTFQYLLAKREAQPSIPFKPLEKWSDVTGMVYCVLSVIPASLLVISCIANTSISGITGIIAAITGMVWMALYFVAIRGRELPDIPED